jgi:CheY-like chemotaxis protein
MIYIVDDDRAVRKSMVRLMRSAGYPARAFASAEEYLGDVHDADKAAACMILDLHLPGMTGADLQQVISSRSRPVPVVIVTASHDAGLCAKALASGATTLLRKPCHSTVLLGAVADALQQSSPPATPSAAPPPASPAAHTETTGPEEFVGGRTGPEGPDAPGAPDTPNTPNDPDNFVLEERRAVYRPVGSVSFDRAVALVRAAIAATHRNGVRALLVDSTALTGFRSPDTFERFLAVVQWAVEARPGVRMAMVAREELIHPQKFGMLVAANMRFVSNIFTTEHEARAWLATWESQ